MREFGKEGLIDLEPVVLEPCWEVVNKALQYLSLVEPAIDKHSFPIMEGRCLTDLLRHGLNAGKQPSPCVRNVVLNVAVPERGKPLAHALRQASKDPSQIWPHIVSQHGCECDQRVISSIRLRCFKQRFCTWKTECWFRCSSDDPVQHLGRHLCLGVPG